MYLNNSVIVFSNSSIVVEVCIYLKENTQFTIDISQYIHAGDKERTITLIKSQKSCINTEGTITIKYSNIQDDCDLIVNELELDALTIIYKDQTCDSQSSQGYSLLK